MTTAIAYRDSLEGARLRYADLLSRAEEGFSLSAVSRVYAARAGRVWAGVAGLAGATAMVVTAAVYAPTLATLTSSRPEHRLSATIFLVLSWPAMAIAYSAGALLALHRARRAASRFRTGDVHEDLARLEAADPREEVRTLAARWPWASVALPMIAVALLAPLSLHLLVAICGNWVEGFDRGWIPTSLLIVGHAHLALAACYWRFASRAEWLDDDALRAERSAMEWKAFGIVVGISALPGAMLYLIPPVLTGVTALVFHPLLFRRMTRTILDERAVLA